MCFLRLNYLCTKTLKVYNVFVNGMNIIHLTYERKRYQISINLKNKKIKSYNQYISTYSQYKLCRLLPFQSHRFATNGIFNLQNYKYWKLENIFNKLIFITNKITLANLFYISLKHSTTKFFNKLFKHSSLLQEINRTKYSFVGNISTTNKIVNAYS